MTKKIETLEDLNVLQEETKLKIKEMKRAEASVRLQLAVKNINSEKLEDMKELLRACYEYIGTHRHYLKNRIEHRTDDEIRKAPFI